MLKSKSMMPPGGWEFYQAEMNWTLPNPLYTGFDQAVAAIVNIRQANPRFNLPTDFGTVAAELEAHTEARLRSLYGDRAKEWITGEPAGGPPVNPLWAPKRSAGAGVAAGNAEVKKAVAGVALITEWLGAGLKPVAKGEANKRAAICVECPKNVAGNLLQKAYGAVADGLHLLMQAKSDLKLATPHDDKLHTCSACDCRLTLKVWTPAKHIKENTSAAVLADLDPKCWILPISNNA